MAGDDDGYVNSDYNYLSLVSSADSNMVAIGAPRRKIRILTPEPLSPSRRSWGGGGLGHMLSVLIKRLLTGTDYPQHLQVWDVASGKDLYAVDYTTYHGGGVFSPDGRRVAIWGLQGAEFWEPGVEKKPVPFLKMVEHVDSGSRADIYKIVFSPDEQIRN